MSSSINPDPKKRNELISQHKTNKLKRTAHLLAKAIQGGDKSALAEGITLLESTAQYDQHEASDLLNLCMPHSGKSIRIGITGVPGVGKSTFIESFGLYLIGQGHRVAVLAVDPSSEKTQGSILGDKTRMNQLAIHPDAYIRPSASKGTLGGVAQKTRESILLCEAAGYDYVLIETVGVGQSETVVHSMTDFFLLLMLAGAGDELQGIKRGIMEMADTIVITKADGANVKPANLAKAQYANALHLFPANTNGWIPTVTTISALENRGMDDVYQTIESFRNSTTISGYFAANRQKQQEYWMMEQIKSTLLNDFFQSPGIEKELEKLKTEMQAGKLSSTQAAHQLIAQYRNGKKNI